MSIRNKVQTFAENHPIAASSSYIGFSSLLVLGLGLVMNVILSKAADYMFDTTSADGAESETPEPITVEEEVISE